METRLWSRLRSAQLGGYKFRRQAALEPYIVDFLCSEKGLVVEVDGDTHDPEKDATRDAELARRGFHVLRFTNAEVGGNLDGVLDSILSTAKRLDFRFSLIDTTHPLAATRLPPSLEREGD